MATEQIDLRSDTVTQPSPAMWAAMATAQVGDDVYGEDPTVNRLERLTAEMLGKEAALYVPSGTMSNLIAQLVHCGRGDEVIVGDRAHTFRSEAGGSAAVGGIHPFTIRTAEDGTLPLDEVRAAVRGDDPHYPRTRLLSLENTHNSAGGRVLPLAYLQAARALCNEMGIALHCDGARMWNAAVSLGVSPATLAAPFDTVSVCLSKGLAAPVGSLLVGSAPFIAEARRARKLVGGGMRQAGILAAAGLIALTEMQERLGDDHANAERLAEGLASAGYRIPHPIETNIVFFDLPTDHPHTAAETSAEWREQGVLISAVGPRRFRAVTHYGIEANHIEKTLSVVGALN